MDFHLTVFYENGFTRVSIVSTGRPSNENSCASSACSSPKGEDKRSNRSRSQLSSITEAELISMAAGDASIIELEELKDQNHETDQDETLVECFEISNQDSIFSDQLFGSESMERY